MERQVWQDGSARSRLADLGLDVEMLHAALLRADAAAATATAFHPTSFEGYMRWAQLVSAMREALTRRGWSFDDPQNLPRALDPSGSRALAVSSGDEFTGVPYAPAGTPTTKNPKGPVVAQAVQANGQLTLDLGARFSAPALSGAREHETWVLLYHYSSEQMRAEVSRPVAMEGSQISAWAERILLPTVPRDPGFVTPEEPTGPDDSDSYEVRLARRV